MIRALICALCRCKSKPARPMLFTSRSRTSGTQGLLSHFEKHLSLSSVCNNHVDCGLCHPCTTHCSNIYNFYTSLRYMQTIKMHTYNLLLALACIKIIVIWESIHFRPSRSCSQLFRCSVQATCCVLKQQQHISFTECLSMPLFATTIFSQLLNCLLLISCME